MKYTVVLNQAICDYFATYDFDNREDAEAKAEQLRKQNVMMSGDVVVTKVYIVENED